MKKPTLKEAKDIIKEYPNPDDFVCRNVSYFMTGGESDDNSIELEQYWFECNRLSKNRSRKK